ncbi:helix-turn-helix transcriptional regulator [Halomonas stenophila]|uniref:Putative DNA-binding transcriptional regulator AlpA n=1 Tax=Halomonas stenophila TaxID=795312 RepID=A0A7W5EW09_9GAMM|nr:DNA-binding protein [Halomonas stenophila]MBB3232057.1 putative DNA-binding transcriptional regulator AlpA [Halomonas stenophila]
MTHYGFTLKFAVPDALEMETLETRLFEAGCDDALVGLGQKGRLALQFSREAASAEEAITSAMADVKHAIPEARLIEAGPDLVGVTDIAELFAFSRQNMRKLLQSHLATFPLPLHEGRASLWHLAEVLEWFRTHQHKAIDEVLSEVARVSMQANVARETRRLPPEEIRRFDALAS